jgi:uncharacterized cupredoxin-like copper-binding protein
VLVYGLSTGHKVGLGVVGLVFIVFALSSSFLFPRFRAQFPGRGLPAFIVVSLVFFFGMLTAVEVFGAEPKETEQSKNAADTFSQAQPTTAVTATTQTTAPATTQQQTTTAEKTTTQQAKPQEIKVRESEFKIQMPTSLKAGKVTFEIENEGALPHDLSIVGGPKSKLVPAKGKATFTATVKSGKVEFYCSVPGHKQAGMDVKVQVS